MTTLGELARLIRSKNAGPFELTFDIIRDSGVLSRETIARIYRLPAAKVKFFIVPDALAFKASIPRPRFQSDVLDSDNHGGQQYAPLIDIEVP